MSQLATDFFRGPVLTELVETPKVKRGIEWTLWPQLKEVGPERPDGPVIKWKRYSGERKGARIVNYNSPGVPIETPGSEWEYGTVLSMKEEYIIDMQTQMLLASAEPYVRLQVQREFAKRMADQSVRFDITRQNMIASAFLTGKVLICQSPKGGIIVPSTASVYNGAYPTLQVDFSATTKTVGAYLSGSSGATVPDFGVSTTDIPQFFRDLTKAFLFVSGYMPKLVTYGRNLPKYMGATNESMQYYLARNPQKNDQYVTTGEIPPGICEMDWKRGYLQYLIDESTTGTTAGVSVPTALLDDDTIVVTPDFDPSWYEFVEGGQMIPTGLMLSMNVEAVRSGAAIAHWGKYSWAFNDPHTGQLTQVVGDNAAPFIKNPNVQWIIKVH